MVVRLESNRYVEHLAGVCHGNNRILRGMNGTQCNGEINLARASGAHEIGAVDGWTPEIHRIYQNLQVEEVRKRRLHIRFKEKDLSAHLIVKAQVEQVSLTFGSIFT